MLILAIVSIHSSFVLRIGEYDIPQFETEHQNNFKDCFYEPIDGHVNEYLYSLESSDSQ